MRVLVPTDLSPDDRAVVTGLGLALAAGKAGVEQAELHLVHVEPPTRDEDQPWPDMRDWLRRWGSQDASLQILTHQLESTDPASAVAERAGSIGPELMVLSSGGSRGVDWFRMGSVAEGIARKAACPVLFLGSKTRGLVDPASGETQIRRVVMPLGSDPDEHQVILDTAARFVERYASGPVTWTFVHAGASTVPDLDLPEWGDWTWEWHLRTSTAVDAIVASAADADLVVMGTHGHDSFFDWVGGSRTERVERKVSCPVLQLRL